MHRNWVQDLIAWILGGIIGVLEAIILQNPISTFFIVSDRSVYIFAFLVYGLAAWFLFRILLILVKTRIFPDVMPRVLLPPGGLLLLLCVLYAAIPGYRWTRRTGATNGKTNIILITLDTTRADHLGCYGYGPRTSPFLDSLAARGVLFEQAYTTATWTLPAHTSLFTGMMPAVHGVGYSNFFVSPEIQTLAEQLQANGYSTAGFIGGPFLVSAFNINQGFDYYDEQLDPHSVLKRMLLFRAASLLLKRNFWPADGQRRANEINNQVFPYLDWVDRREPFFLFVNYFDPHEPYDPPESARREMDIHTALAGHLRHFVINKRTGVAEHRDGTEITEEEFRQLRSLYDGEIRFLDDQLSLLWQKLESEGLLDNTMVILAGDHGESIGEHQFLDHGHTLYQEQVHVPLLVLGPGDWTGGKRIVTPVQIMDVFPTILLQAGLTPVETIQGRNLAPLLLNAGAMDRPVLAELDIDPHPRYKAFQRSLRMILEQQNKLIEASNQMHEMYDLVRDPLEKDNMIRNEPEAAQQMRDRMNDHFRLMGTMRHKGQHGELDPETREKLKALGYIE